VVSTFKAAERAKWAGCRSQLRDKEEEEEEEGDRNEHDIFTIQKKQKNITTLGAR
jgi:hypothetical protein